MNIQVGDEVLVEAQKKPWRSYRIPVIAKVLKIDSEGYHVSGIVDGEVVVGSIAIGNERYIHPVAGTLAKLLYA